MKAKTKIFAMYVYQSESPWSASKIYFKNKKNMFIEQSLEEIETMPSLYYFLFQTSVCEEPDRKRSFILKISPPECLGRAVRARARVFLGIAAVRWARASVGMTSRGGFATMSNVHRQRELTASPRHDAKRPRALLHVLWTLSLHGALPRAPIGCVQGTDSFLTFTIYHNCRFAHVCSRHCCDSAKGHF